MKKQTKKRRVKEKVLITIKNRKKYKFKKVTKYQYYVHPFANKLVGLKLTHSSYHRMLNTYLRLVITILYIYIYRLCC